jgi:ubiquinone/menaquinone biosynthesis C-methylase UbiE
MEMDETSRIRKAYERRDASGIKSLYSLFNPASLYLSRQRESAIIDMLGKNGVSDLAGKKVLDLGCGAGAVLRDFVKYGARPGDCFGIDLLPDRVEAARDLSPNIDFRCGTGEELPYADGSFDIVLCFTVFTSILDRGMKRSVAGEIQRVLRPGGMVLWYDYHMDNPRNPDVKGVKKGEIRGLFPSCDIDLKRVTLAPPLARAIAPYSVILCMVLEKVPLLCTHYLGVIRKRLDKF